MLASLPGIGWLLGLRAAWEGRPWFHLIFWIAVPAACLVARWFLVEFLGDVAVYISAHKVSQFQEVRRKIQEAALDVAKAVYKAEGEDGTRLYDRVVVVGHSLGSIIAYDTLNAMINEDMLGKGTQ